MRVATAVVALMIVGCTGDDPLPDLAAGGPEASSSSVTTSSVGPSTSSSDPTTTTSTTTALPAATSTTAAMATTTSTVPGGVDAAMSPLFGVLDERFVGGCDAPIGPAAEGSTCVVVTDPSPTETKTQRGPISFLVWFLDDFTGDEESPFTALDGVPSMSTAVLDGAWRVVAYHNGGYSPSVSDRVNLNADGLASFVSFWLDHPDLLITGASVEDVLIEVGSVLGEPDADSGASVESVCGPARIIRWGDLTAGFSDDRLWWWRLDGPAHGDVLTSGDTPWPFGEPIDVLVAAVFSDVDAASESGGVMYHEFHRSPTGRAVAAVIDDNGAITHYQAGQCAIS